MTEWVWWFVATELLLCGAYTMYEELRAEREDVKLPPGIYRLTWGSLTEGR